MTELYNKVKEKGEKKQATGATKKHSSKTVYYERDPEISAFAKRRAQGICDLCDSKAPFEDGNGRPYLESHHIVWLSNGGADEIDNVVALCPNCHRKMHVGASEDDFYKLNAKALTYRT